ncbi:TPA_asm: VP1 [African termite bidnaparvovirus]|nr:TPA_asm: VP1 [African termite bidnaparvovirus]
MSYLAAALVKDGGSSGPPPAKKSKGEDTVDGGGGGSGSAIGGGTEVSPIPRGVSSTSITIFLTQRSWEEISATAIYYIPLCYSLWAMLDHDNVRDLYQWFRICKSFQLNDVKFKCSNFIILNDVLGSGANPTEVSWFAWWHRGPLGFGPDLFISANGGDPKNYPVTFQLVLEIGTPLGWVTPIITGSATIQNPGDRVQITPASATWAGVGQYFLDWTFIYKHNTSDVPKTYRPVWSGEGSRDVSQMESLGSISTNTSVSAPSQISSIVQRAKIVHFSPRYKNSRRFYLSHAPPATTPQGISFIDPSNVPVTAFTAPANQFTVAPVPAPTPNRNYILRSNIDTNFEDVQMLAGGQTAGYMGNGPFGNQTNQEWGNHDTGFGLPSAGSGLADMNQGHLVGQVVTSDQRDQSVAANPNSILKRNDPAQQQIIRHVKNLANFKIIGGDDIIDETVVTNLDGVLMTPKTFVRAANLAVDGNVQTYSVDAQYRNFTLQGFNPIVYNMGSGTNPWRRANPIWPNFNNPVMGKSGYINPLTTNFLNRCKPLSHHFLTMIPIKQQSGGILNQRANFLFEQTASFTFHMDAGWDDFEAMTNIEGAFIRMLQVGAQATQAPLNTQAYFMFNC